MFIFFINIALEIISSIAYINIIIPTIWNANVLLTNTTIPDIIISKEHTNVTVQRPDFISFHTNAVWKFLTPQRIIHIPKIILNTPLITSEQNRTITPNITDIKAIVNR